jgi:hypothetical protein
MAWDSSPTSLTRLGGRRLPVKSKRAMRRLRSRRRLMLRPMALPPPSPGQQQQRQNHGQPDEVQRTLPGLGGQLVQRQHLQQLEHPTQADIDLGVQPHPLPTIDGQDLRFAGVPGGLLQAQQFRLADGVQHGLGVAVAAVQVHRGRHHLPAAVQQGQARARGGAQPHQHLLQVVKGHIDTDHGIARGGLLAQVTPRRCVVAKR